MKLNASSRLLLAALIASTSLHAQSVGDSGNLNMVTVGDAGNAADTTGYGAVAYTYSIGAYDVTNAQYAAFLNDVGQSNAYGVYNTNMASVPTSAGFGGIVQSGSSGSYTYSVAAQYANMPVVYVSVFSAARYANWLTNGATAGASTETGMYALGGATSGDMTMFTRTSGSGYAITSENEWYKAAYYKGGSTNAGYWLYATQSNSEPTAAAPNGAANQANCNNAVGGLTPVGAYTGSVSAYGTYDQNGNALQLTDTSYDSSNNYSVMRSGDYRYSVTSASRSLRYPTNETATTGFRVSVLTTVPEPSTYGLIGAGAFATAAIIRRRLRK